MRLREALRSNMKSGEYYTSGQIMKFLCPTQSSTVEYLLVDAVTAGYLQEGISKTANRVFRINQ